MTRPPSALKRSCDWLQMLSICFFFVAFQLSCLMLGTYPQIKHLFIKGFPEEVKVVGISGDGH